MNMRRGVGRIVGGALMLGLGIAAQKAQAYECDTHFIITIVQCQAAGMTYDEALVVARYDQGMDDSAGTLANGGPGGLIPNTDEEHLWHAIPIGGSRSAELSRKSALWNKVLAQTDKNNQLLRLGVFFHYQQDTWAHRHHPNSSSTSWEPYSVPFGHAMHGHQPDRPPFDPVCALRCLEEGISYARTFVQTCLKRTPNAMFNGYAAASGQVDSGWDDSRKGKYFNQLAADNSNPARKFLTDLIRSQINCYKSSIDANPNFLGRYTADEVDFNTVRSALLGACQRAGVAIQIPTSSTRNPITSLTTAQLGETNLGTTSYKIVVKTGTVSGAGTDSNISISIKGSKATIGFQNLDTDSHNDFENGQTDTYYLSGYQDVGEIESITLKSDNSGIASGWYCEYVEVSGINRPATRFAMNGWLESPNLTRTLSKPGTASNYRVTVRTGDVSGAGTDANIFITINGTKGSISNRALDTAGHNDFERNQSDVYNLNGFPDIGEITSITVRSDDSGLGSGWYVAYIDVYSSKTGQNVRFTCNCWFEKPNLTRTFKK